MPTTTVITGHTEGGSQRLRAWERARNLYFDLAVAGRITILSNRWCNKVLSSSGCIHC